MTDDEKLGIDLTPKKDGGVLKMLLREGDGTDGPCKGDKVSVHYDGTLQDGTKFDSSRDRGDKFEFTLGMDEVIKGWDLCVASMKKGELCKIFCKPDYAYGSTGSPPKIPPNSTLIFEIELFSWKSEDLSPENDGGITRKTIKSGKGFTTPNDGALVKLNIKGRLGDRMFLQKDEFSFILGEGCLHNIPDGLETALLKFKKSEHSIVRLQPKYAFGVVGNKEFDIPADSEVEYEIQLIEFEKQKEAHEMEKPEKLQQSVIFKELGTTFFKQDNLPFAIKKYTRVIDLLAAEDETDSERNKLLLASRLNLSMCYLKQKNFISAKQQAEEALILDADNIKGHFRLGMSMLGVKDHDEALKSFQKCLQIESGNQAALQQLKICQQAINEYKVQEKKMYSAMFERVSE